MNIDVKLEINSQHFLRFHAGVTLVGRVANWVYFKIPTKGKMMSETVENTCNSVGMVTPCYSPSHADSNCVQTQTSDLFFHIQQALCPDASRWTCPPLNEVCMYMRKGWSYGSAVCNLMNTGYAGNGYSNKNSLCAFEV